MDTVFCRGVFEVTIEFGLLLVIAIFQILIYARHKDCEERIHMARQQAHRETHNQWATTHRNATNIYRRALEEGREDAGNSQQDKDMEHA